MNFGTNGCMYNCGDSCTGECIGPTNNEQEELKFDKETADGLYRIFCGLSRSVYENAEVYDAAKPNMEKAYNMILEWGRNNCDDMRGEKLK
jgi:hypothetical protein